MHTFQKMGLKTYQGHIEDSLLLISAEEINEV